MKKIKNSKNSKKTMALKIKKLLLCSGMVLTCGLSLTGCKEDASGIQKEIKGKKDLKETSGFIKEGDTLIPFYYDGALANRNYHNFETGEYIGHRSAKTFNNTSYGVVVNDENEIIYTQLQTIYFNDAYPDVYCNAEIVENFDEEVYKKYEEKYLQVQTFGKGFLNHYELESMETGEVTTLIGYQVSNTQFFNFETFSVEEYKGYNVTLVMSGANLENNMYSYGEILDMLEQTEEDILEK